MNFKSVILIFFFATQSFAKEPTVKGATDFSTPRDFEATVKASNLKLKNTRSTSTTVYGLYVRQLSSVAPRQPCTGATSIYLSSTNLSAGSVVMPVSLEPNAEAAIGANYLYNMIYNALYYVQIAYPSSPPGCALPGCTWGADSTIYNWCIYIGAMAPVSVTSNYTSKVSPSMVAVSGAGYDYNLVSEYQSIGPISCNDQTLTCIVPTPQLQSF